MPEDDIAVALTRALRKASMALQRLSLMHVFCSNARFEPHLHTFVVNSPRIAIPTCSSFFLPALSMHLTEIP